MAKREPLSSSRLRHRIEIQSQTVSQDPATGEMKTSWVKYGDRWAEYVASSVAEFIAASSTQSKVAGRFVIRSDEGVMPEMRIIFKGKVHAILGVMPDPDSGLDYMTLAVSAGVIFDGR